MFLTLKWRGWGEQKTKQKKKESEKERESKNQEGGREK